MSVPQVSITNGIATISGGDIIASGVKVDAILPLIEADIHASVAKNVTFFKYIVTDMLQRFVPVRTGKLLDNLLNTLRVEYIGHTVIVSAVTPTGYPIIIKNPAHYGSIGYGYGHYEPINSIRNRIKLRDTPKGGYYLLKDSEAIGDYQAILENFVVPRITTIIEALPFEYEVTISLPKRKENNDNSTIAEPWDKSVYGGIVWKPSDFQTFKEYDTNKNYYTLKVVIRKKKVAPVIDNKKLKVAWLQEEYYEGEAVDFSKWDSD